MTLFVIFMPEALNSRGAIHADIRQHIPEITASAEPRLVKIAVPDVKMAFK